MPWIEHVELAHVWFIPNIIVLLKWVKILFLHTCDDWDFFIVHICFMVSLAVQCISENQFCYVLLQWNETGNKTDHMGWHCQFYTYPSGLYYWCWGIILHHSQACLIAVPVKQCRKLWVNNVGNPLGVFLNKQNKAKLFTTYVFHGIYCTSQPGGHLNTKMSFYHDRIPIIKIRQSHDCLIFIMITSIPGKMVFTGILKQGPVVLLDVCGAKVWGNYQRRL